MAGSTCRAVETGESLLAKRHLRVELHTFLTDPLDLEPEAPEALNETSGHSGREAGHTREKQGFISTE